tara:strand:- start:57 stop:344 length:288 start_codon:yes stop_codon:yes gene_type:complete
MNWEDLLKTTWEERWEGATHPEDPKSKLPEESEQAIQEQIAELEKQIQSLKDLLLTKRSQKDPRDIRNWKKPTSLIDRARQHKETRQPGYAKRHE